MSTTVSEPEGGEVTLHPEGAFGAICADVYDVGTEQTQYGPKDRVLIVWETTEQHPEFSGPHRVNRKYTASLHSQASLRHDLESWRGKPFSDDELKGFDLENLLGVPALLTIRHTETGGQTYANVEHVAPPNDDVETPGEVSQGYIRIKNREDTYDGQGAQPDDTFPEDKDDLPF
jgi:hypothetical protein